MYNIHCVSWSILALLVEQSDYIQIMGFSTSSNQIINISTTLEPTACYGKPTKLFTV